MEQKDVLLNNLILIDGVYYKAAGTNRMSGTQIMISGKVYYAHALVHLEITGKLPEKAIKHKDGNKYNNNPNNLCYKDGTEFEAPKKKGGWEETYDEETGEVKRIYKI